MDCKVTHSFVFQPKADPFFNLHFRPECQSERKKTRFLSFLLSVSTKTHPFITFCQRHANPTGKIQRIFVSLQAKTKSIKDS